MNGKVDIELVRLVLQRAEIDAQKTSQIIEDLRFESRAKKEDEDREPRIKRQSVVVVNDPYGKIAELGWDFAAYVLDIPEDDHPAKALPRLHRAVYDFNLTPKGRRMPITTVAEACEFGSAKIFKEHKVWVKTKEPVAVLLTKGRIPREQPSE